MLSMGSCSKGPETKSGFKILVGGNLAALSSSGGAYISAFNQRTNTSEIYKLDTTDSALIPFGSYDLQAIGFEGPGDRTGPILCSSLSNINLSTEEITITMNVSQSECAQSKYHNTILTIKNGVSSRWNFDLYGAAHWGP